MNEVGFLVSQIGHDAADPVRVVLRGPEGLVSPAARCRFVGRDGAVETSLSPFGPMWGSHWWTAEVTLPPGRYVAVAEDGRLHRESDPFEVGHDLLWHRTWMHVGPGQGRRRAVFAMNKVGWQDCGTAWQEANSHAAYALGFLDLLEFRGDQLGPHRDEVIAQVRQGADYLALLQDHAESRGHPKGSLSHQTPKYDDVVLPGDAAKAAVVWARAARLLPQAPEEYRLRAEESLQWLHEARPHNPSGIHSPLHGAPPDYDPGDQETTRELMMRCWAHVELALAGHAHLPIAVALADQAISRQVAMDENEGGLYGHFFTYPDRRFTEKAWTHHIDGGIFSPDAGGHFPNWVLPILRLWQHWPDHPDALKWKRALRSFAEGYLIPACGQNPFRLLPQGFYPGQGLLWFAGLWHGITAAYGLTAALALELARALEMPELRSMAVGNLQWIAGLNAGITRDSLKGSVMWSMDIPEGVALPASLIQGIGNRWAGNWLTIRGSICNGFAVGEQFRFGVAPTLENDAPSSFTDEDWISHGGAWLSAVARL